MAVTTSAGAEVQRPLATVVIGGGLIYFDALDVTNSSDALWLV